VQIFPGNYEDYLWRKQGGQAAVEESARASTGEPAAAVPEEARARRVNPIRVRQMEKRRAAIEKEVARLETEIARYDAEMADFKSVEETQRLSALAEECRAALEALLKEWEEVSATIEASR
jgi:ATP-binding cassette subfamily F protein 3